MNIETINKKAEIAAAVRYEAVDFTNMSSVMSEGYQKLWAYIAEHGKQVSGVPYCKYTNGSKDFMIFDIELGIPVSEALPEKGEFYMSKTDEGKAVAAMHKGAYKDIGKVCEQIMQYISENNLQHTGTYYDYYINNPADTPESELLTRVVFMLK